jgi:ATP-binding cassette subfamily B protein
VGARDAQACSGVVEMRDVDFGYADGPDILSGFSLTLRPGETVALVGRSGCGKSTVARLLARWYDVRSGAVLLDGVDIRELTQESLQRHIGLVPDDAFLFSASIHDNVAYARPGASRRDVLAATEAAGATEFIKALPAEFDTVVGERGYTLSGGQRQRLPLARMLLANPPVLLLDDATSALDVHVEQQLHDGLRALLHGRTVLVVAHRLSTIALADRVVLMSGGRVAAEGTHGELLERVPEYAELLLHIEEEWAATHTEPRPAMAGVPVGASGDERPELSPFDGDGLT